MTPHIGGVLALFLSAALFGATEFPVVTDILLKDPPDVRTSIALASDADGYLAVWSDFRAYRVALIATRIGSTGEVLDPTGIYIAPYHTQASIVWNGERYLVFFVGDGALRMTTIDRDGIASSPVVLIEHVQEAAVATNGSRILVSYVGGSVANRGARVATLDMNGGVVLDMEADLHSARGSSVAVLPNGDFVVGWNTVERSIWTLYALRFDADGTRAEFVPRFVGDEYQPAALHANGDALIASSVYRCWGVSSDLRDLSAQVLCPEGPVFSLHGRAALVSANNSLDLSLSLFDEQGHTVEQKPLFQVADVPNAKVWNIAAVQKDADVLIAWTIGGRLSARIISADSLQPKTSEIALTSSADGQLNPSIAVGETGMLIAWEERGGVYASRITFDGRRLDGPGILLSTNSAGTPRAVFHEGRYAVAFLQSDGIEYSRVVVRTISPRDGLLPEVATAGTGDNVALASGGGTLLVVWTERDLLMATRVHPGGTTDPTVVVARKGDVYPTNPAAAWNGSHFLVAWVDISFVTDHVRRGTISGRRLTRDLGIDGDVLALADGKEVDPFETPGLASIGGEWFLAWSRENQVRLARIVANGAVLSELHALHGSAPQLTVAGRQLVLAAKSFGNVNIQAGETFTTIPSLPYDGFSLTARASKWYAAFTRLGGTDVGHVERVYVASPGPRRRTVR